jgi:hypothetical protein
MISDEQCLFDLNKVVMKDEKRKKMQRLSGSKATKIGGSGAM